MTPPKILEERVEDMPQNVEEPVEDITQIIDVPRSGKMSRGDLPGATRVGGAELDEQKSTEALERLGHKHKFGKSERERDRARMLQEKELPVAEGDFTIATSSSSLCCCAPSLAHDVDEEVSTPLYQALSMGKERDWWSAGLEGEMEKQVAE